MVWYSPATTDQETFPVAWQATLRPYKHQITHLGTTFDIVISPENFFVLL